MWRGKDLNYPRFQNTIGSASYKMLTVVGEATMEKIGQTMLDSSPRMWKQDLQQVKSSCIPNKDTLITTGSQEVAIWRMVDMVDWIVSGRTLMKKKWLCSCK